MSGGGNNSGTQQFSEDEQIKAAKRIALIQHLPIHQFTKENFQLKKNPTECDICMNDFAIGEFVFVSCSFQTQNIKLRIFFITGDRVRYLPCMHQVNFNEIFISQKKVV